MYDRKASGYSDANVRLSGVLAVEKGSKLFIYDSQDGLRVATVCLDPGDIVDLPWRLLACGRQIPQAKPAFALLCVPFE